MRATPRQAPAAQADHRRRWRRFRAAAAGAASVAGVSRLALALTAALAIVGAVRAGTDRVALYLVDVEAPALTEALGPARLLHVSDLHVRAVGDRERRLLALAAAARPDLILVTGDLAEPPGRGRPADLGPPVAVMRRLAAIAPTVTVLGNNDLSYRRKRQVVDTERLVAALREAGVTVLRNRAVLLERRPFGATSTSGEAPARPRRAGEGVATGVYLVGVDDNYLNRDDLDAALRGVPPGPPAILLAHSPDIVVDRDVSRFALVLAGHTHGGQIRLPMVGTLETQTRTRRYIEGLYRLPHGGWLHVSGGVGTSEIPLRFLVQPSATLLRLTGE